MQDFAFIHQKVYQGFANIFGVDREKIIYGWIQLYIQYTNTDIPIDILQLIRLYFGKVVNVNDMRYKRFMVIIDRTEVKNKGNQEFWMYETSDNLAKISKGLAIHSHWFTTAKETFPSNDTDATETVMYEGTRLH